MYIVIERRKAHKIKRIMLEKAIKIALNAHRGQKDRGGNPYILHCFRVMLSGDTIEEQIIGVLHDTVEDSPLTFKDLEKAGFSREIIDAIDSISKRPGEKYNHYLLRVHSNPLATKVKLRDIKDNMNVKRLGKLTPKDLERGLKYYDAYNFLKH